MTALREGLSVGGDDASHIVPARSTCLHSPCPPSLYPACLQTPQVQVKLLPDLVDGPAPYAFELWSIAKIWRFGVATEADRAKWVSQIQQQVRYLLASFKQRGKSLAFIPQNVALLRDRLRELQQQKEIVELQARL